MEYYRISWHFKYVSKKYICSGIADFYIHDGQLQAGRINYINAILVLKVNHCKRNILSLIFIVIVSMKWLYRKQMNN